LGHLNVLKGFIIAGIIHSLIVVDCHEVELQGFTLLRSILSEATFVKIVIV
jgi:hypothetical protein